MSRFTAEQYESLFEKDVHSVAEQDNDTRERIGKLGHQAVMVYRTKRVSAGDNVDLMIYPVWVWQREATRAKKAKPTEAAQQAQNRKDAQRRLIWKMNANFTEEDLFLTLTYKGDQPATVEEARSDMQAYIRRVKRWRDRQGLPELKYIYSIEHGSDGRKKRVHHHIVMSGMDRDVAEQIWDKGRANSAKLQPDEYGLEGLARYITKDPKGKKLWCCSRNLKKPRITVSDKKVTKRNVERMASNEAAIRELLERREPGYLLNNVTIKRSDQVSGVYITAKLRRVSSRARSPARDGPGSKPDSKP